MPSSSRRAFSWLSPKPLIQSRNDRLARWLDDPTDQLRQAWMERLGTSYSDLVIDYNHKGNVSFLVAGDTGEGDASQFAVVPSLRRESDDTDFLFICSDVIYPAGGINEYKEKFFRPYKGYCGSIYAVPGNHDWYDNATGFMYWFCDADEAPAVPTPRLLSKAWLRRLLWRRAPDRDSNCVDESLKLRTAPFQQQRPQPGPYFAIDTGPIRLVGIDTGILGGIDQEQGRWLRWVSAQSDKPKILLTGKPLVVDGELHRCDIGGGGTVKEIVDARDHNYVAVIGGDIHNYQRYPIHLDAGRTLMCLVSGGGGAFMHETHTIPNIDKLELKTTEDEFRCYPLRGDSLSRFSQLYARKLRWVLGPFWRRLYIEHEVAKTIMSERLGVPPTRPGRVSVSRRDRIAASLLFKIHHRAQRGLHIPFSEWLDWNQPPMFKSFLRIDADSSEIRIRCFAATGCRSLDDHSVVEDDLVATRGSDGSWSWTLPTHN